MLDIDTPVSTIDASFSSQQSLASATTIPPSSPRPTGFTPAATNLYASQLPALNRSLFATVSPPRRPFQLLMRIQHSIAHGAHLTPKLFAPKPIWAQAGIKLAALETKVRMIEMLLNALEGIDQIGEPLLHPAKSSPENIKYTKQTAERLAQELDMLSQVMENIEGGLAKKLSLTDAPGVKKGGWQAKMRSGLDKMTANKSSDAPQNYVDGLSRLCETALPLDRHIAALQGESTHPSAYEDIPTPVRTVLASRLHRASDFFGTVVGRWILTDVALLLDKHTKRSGAWAAE